MIPRRCRLLDWFGKEIARISTNRDHER